MSDALYPPQSTATEIATASLPTRIAIRTLADKRVELSSLRGQPPMAVCPCVAVQWSHCAVGNGSTLTPVGAEERPLELHGGVNFEPALRNMAGNWALPQRLGANWDGMQQLAMPNMGLVTTRLGKLTNGITGPCM